MKFRLYILVIFCSFLISAVSANPGNPLVEKRKTYSKSYTLSGSDRVSLSNQFGEMKIMTWDKNEIKVDITIVTKASSEDVAQNILDRINIEDGKSGGEVFFKTKMKDMNDNRDKKNKGEYKEQSMKIDYLVYMPATNSLEANNQFGPMNLPDFKGTVDLESKFGSLTTGKLLNVKSVNVEFGSATIAHINSGKLTIKFSKGTIESMSGNVDLLIEFCEKIKIGLGNDLKDFNLKTNYSTVYLDASSNLSAYFDIHTNFGEFKNKTSFPINEEKSSSEKHGPKFDKDYTGKAGTGSNKVNIRSEFGEVILGHNLQVDFSEKKEKKKESRVI
jgi:hypothetical protein